MFLVLILLITAQTHFARRHHHHHRNYEGNNFAGRMVQPRYDVIENYNFTPEGEDVDEDEILRAFKDEILKNVLIKNKAYLRSRDEEQNHKYKYVQNDILTKKTKKSKIKNDVNNSQAGLRSDFDHTENDVRVVYNTAPESHSAEDLVKREKQDNEGVATVTEDDGTSFQEELLKDIKPEDLFLEPNAKINKTNSSVTPSPAGEILVRKVHHYHSLDKVVFLAIVVGCCVAGVAGLILLAYCWCRLRKGSKFNHAEGFGGDYSSMKKQPSAKLKNCPDDAKLAENAEMFHYIHQKKQMQQLNSSPPKGKYAEVQSDEEGDENTVYECPGLAPPGDMKVSNPMFSDTESTHRMSGDSHSDVDSPPPPYQTPPVGATPPPTQIEGDGGAPVSTPRGEDSAPQLDDAPVTPSQPDLDDAIVPKEPQHQEEGTIQPPRECRAPEEGKNTQNGEI